MARYLLCVAQTIWLNHHDYELNLMRAGIERIEGRSATLQVQEANQERLQHTLEALVDALQLGPELQALLAQPRLEEAVGSLAKYQQLTAAARRLAGRIRARQQRLFERMTAVQQVRAQYLQLRDQFCKAATAYFEVRCHSRTRAHHQSLSE